MNDKMCCYSHPKEAIVGVCALCLKERLVKLASKQGQLPLPKETNKSFRILRRKPAITLDKVFALGSFLHLLEFRQQNLGQDSDDGSLASLEDSFISIKFEDNGHGLRDNQREDNQKHCSKLTTNGISTCNQVEGKVGKIVVEHAKPRGTLRWRNRIGHLFQLARWKRPTKADQCHVGLVGKAEGRRGWMRRLTGGGRPRPPAPT